MFVFVFAMSHCCRLITCFLMLCDDIETGTKSYESWNHVDTVHFTKEWTWEIHTIVTNEKHHFFLDSPFVARIFDIETPIQPILTRGRIKGIRLCAGPGPQKKSPENLPRVLSSWKLVFRILLRAFVVALWIALIEPNRYRLSCLFICGNKNKSSGARFWW